MQQFSEEQSEPEKELLKIRQLWEQRDFESGEKLMIELLEKFPDFLVGRMHYADFLLQLGDSFDALNVLRPGLKDSSENSDFRYLIGVARQKCWFLSLAEKDFEFLMQAKPKDPEILRMAGWTKVLKGEVEEGRGLLRQAIDLDITNDLPYLDLGASYALSLDFKEALNFLETAKSLSRNKSLAIERIKETTRIEKEFKKFPKEKQKKMREMRSDPAELKLMAIQNLLLLSQENSLAEDELNEIKEELKLAGVNPRIMTFKPPKTEKEKTVFEYMKCHQEVPDVERKVSEKEFQEIKEKLLNAETEENELKKLLLVLAHQGDGKSTALLKGYLKRAPAQLKDWVKLALNECKMFKKAKPGQVVKILH